MTACFCLLLLISSLISSKFLLLLWNVVNLFKYFDFVPFINLVIVNNLFTNYKFCVRLWFVYIAKKYVFFQYKILIYLLTMICKVAFDL